MEKIKFLVFLVIISTCLSSKIDGTKKHNLDYYSRKNKIGKNLFRLSNPEECKRNCTEGEPPRICYYHFTLERYNVLGGACSECSVDEDNTTCTNPQCILGDGVERSIWSTNRKVPGPDIQVCRGDKVIVDVKNDVYGAGLTVHWHGLKQEGTPYADGVPFLTQCPIENGNTFRYIWEASNAGTHFWHSHTGLHKLNGLYGPLIIREPRSEDPAGDLFDYDLPEHVLLLSDALHEDSSEHFPGKLSSRFHGQVPASLLINGKGQYQDRNTHTVTPLETFTIRPGKKYKFRLINSMATVCPAVLTIEGHSLEVVASDGEPFEPVQVDSLVSFSGERYDFLIEANKNSSTYWIQIRGLRDCATGKTQQLAKLRYEGADLRPLNEKPEYDVGLPLGTILNPVDSNCEGSNSRDVCLDRLKNAESVEDDVLNTEPDVKLYMPFTFLYYTTEELFQEGHYNRYLVTGSGKHTMSLINGISFKPPTSPPLSQLNDISPEQFCNGDNRPQNCPKNCSCTHVYDAPLHGIVEIVLVDVDKESNMSHAFHLHGQPFYVLTLGRNPDNDGNEITRDTIQNWDAKGLLHRNLESPIKKDTIAVPSDGYTILRFKADNPGYWLFHCHFMYHVAIGMNFVIHVGEKSDLPPVPENFPKCGDYLPPIDF